MSTTSAPKTTRGPRSGGFLGGDRGGARSKGVRTRARSKSLITLAALLVLGFGLATAYLVTSAGDKASVLVVGTDVPKGREIDRSALVLQSVSGVSNAIPVDQVGEVVGKTAAVDLVVGQIITTSMVTAAPVPVAGESVVGLSLDPTRAPSSGLTAGDVVDVIAVPGAEQGGKVDPTALDTPTILAAGATVYAIEGVATDGGQMLLTLVVDDADANKVAAYSTSGQVAVVEVTASGDD